MDTDKRSVAKAVANIGRQHYQTTATSANHAIIVDEPKEMNGSDTGMSPFGLLLSSLGSCTAITLRMYIDRKMWPVEEINIELEVFAVPKGHLIESRISVKGDLEHQQISRLIDIANACPIHRLLAGNIMMNTIVA
ncbi:OsmC family protein [Mucilaginibacter sp. CSA2-8R]|uniref:OsmC family protein n=1 Tax=Mucilaginibacter sp. CSA2-8R TaxID=3141542 RepID=UPI00315D3057